ncbi:hypothetical protein EAH89_24325 [Roseomonas nepalensis]|uniref:Uncharacterized protein n=1 Tax=Muricoccus nepalensis TaxID=1854500 RepID=A0A502FCA1_9PROT|nr:hypothetical protein [Roseomonas nepalensis]TPG46929.1 hypothetical protein EAH89_24325 [Roseomonas nepalensis]
MTDNGPASPAPGTPPPESPAPWPPPSLLERAGVGRGGRLVAAVLIVLLAPLWLPLYFLAIGVAAKLLPRLRDAARLEEAWSTLRSRPGRRDSAP